MQTAGIAREGMSVCLSVRPSVRLSVALRYCIKMKKASGMISSPSESLNILVSRNIWLITKFERGHPERGRFMRLGWVKIGNFDDFSTNNPPYLRNGARQDQGYYWSLIGNPIRAFDWYQNQRHWITLKWPWTAIMCSVALHACVSEPTTENWMKIDPYCQRQKCSPGIAVSKRVRFMRIFAEVRWPGGLQMRVGLSKMAIFTYFTRYIFRTFTSKTTLIILCYM